MPSFILNKASVILCPHGGFVTHHPTSFTTYNINGMPPLLMNDLYFVAGCPFIIGGSGGNPCHMVIWLTGSVFLLINGVPALINTSIGTCNSINGIPNGPAIIAAFQTQVMEPETITSQ